MGTVGAPHTSGDWHVSEGKEQEFIAAWTELARWSKEAFEGARSVALYQQDADPRHFISVGAWDSKETVGKWRSSPEFQQKLGAARALCDDFAGLDYTLVVDQS